MSYACVCVGSVAEMYRGICQPCPALTFVSQRRELADENVELHFLVVKTDSPCLKMRIDATDEK